MVTKDLTRKAVSIAWDPAGAHDNDLVDITAENPDTGDVSSRKGLKNDGLVVFTFPADYHGTTRFTVTDPDNSDKVIDEGDIDV